MARLGQLSAAFVSAWAGAIATFEGFYISGSRPARNHNPGDLKYAGQPGAVGQDSAGFAMFPDDPTGWTALDNQLQAYVNEFPSYSLFQIMEHYLGQNVTASGGQTTSQGNSTTYAQAVAGALGVDPSTTLSDLVQLGLGAPAVAVDASLSPAEPASPLDSQDGSANPGMIVLLVGGAIAFVVISYFFGWGE
jgi:hypothetical protein